VLLCVRRPRRPLAPGWPGERSRAHHLKPRVSLLETVGRECRRERARELIARQISAKPLTGRARTAWQNIAAAPDRGSHTLRTGLRRRQTRRKHTFVAGTAGLHR